MSPWSLVIGEGKAGRLEEWYGHALLPAASEAYHQYGCRRQGGPE